MNCEVESLKSTIKKLKYKYIYSVRKRLFNPNYWLKASRASHTRDFTRETSLLPALHAHPQKRQGSMFTFAALTSLPQFPQWYKLSQSKTSSSTYMFQSASSKPDTFLTATVRSRKSSWNIHEHNFENTIPQMFTNRSPTQTYTGNNHTYILF